MVRVGGAAVLRGGDGSFLVGISTPDDTACGGEEDVSRKGREGEKHAKGAKVFEVGGGLRWDEGPCP